MAPVGFSGRSSNNWGLGTKGSGGNYGHNYTDSAQTDDYDFRTWTGLFDDGWGIMIVRLVYLRMGLIVA